MEKISALPEVIGYITYEYGKAPKELKAAVARLKVLKDSFKDCN